MCFTLAQLKMRGHILSVDEINISCRETKKRVSKRNVKSKKPNLLDILLRWNNDGEMKVLQKLIRRCETGEFPSSLNGYLVPAPRDPQTMEIYLELGIQLSSISILLSHDLVSLTQSEKSHFLLGPRTKESYLICSNTNQREYQRGKNKARKTKERIKDKSARECSNSSSISIIDVHCISH
jgi:hypothetical protein